MATININYIDGEQFVSAQEQAYLAYASLTLAGRSLPHIQDGLKPVHRRILYAMQQLTMTNKGGHKKSARVVGDVIGKYHPHGDSAVYDAMVGMAQPWNYRYPLIDGQGNWGARDGDGAAAMRYTETKPSAYADFVQQEISKSAARYKPNFDNTNKEPEYMPVSFPNILCNGGEGIGVGMRCYVPPHNVQEVVEATAHMIENPDCTTEDLMEFIPAPDFPTGGQITNSKAELLSMYKSGKGSLRIRAKWEAEKRKRGQYVIIVDELPHRLSPSSVLAYVDDVLSYDPNRDNKDGKKDTKVNQNKLDLKSFLKANLEKISDISDTTIDAKEGKLLIEPKTCSRSPEEFMESMIPALGLEVKFSVEFNLMSIDYRPRLRTLKGTLEDWVEYRRETMIRRCEARKSGVEARLEIIGGRLSIMDSIDEVIAIIRDSETPLEDLMARFELTERQASDIMDIKLRELRRLEENKLEDEKEKLEKELKSLISLISSKTRMGKLLIKEMREAAKALGDERRTEVREAEVAQFDKTVKSNNTDPVTLFITDQGWLMSRKGHDSEAPEKMLKPDDYFTHTVNVRQNDDVIIFSASGRSYTVSAEDFPSGATSTHINTLVNISTDKVIKAFPYVEGEKYLLCQSYGLGFVVETSSLHSRQKNGKEVFRLGKFDDAQILLMEKLLLASNGTPLGSLNIQTTTGRFMQFDFASPESVINEYPKSQGLQLCKLSKKDGELVAFYGVTHPDTIPASGQITHEVSQPAFIGKDGELTLDPDVYVKKRAGTPVKLK